MAFTRITDADLGDKGVVGQPEVPGLTALEMQQKVEQIVREVAIPGLNRLAGELEAAAGAASLGMERPAGVPETVPATVQGIIAAHLESRENPHGVTAAQVEAYTRAETDAAISKKVVEIGAGGMAQAVYAANGQAGVVDEAADAQKLGGQPPAFYASRTYTAELPAEGWTGSVETGYTQTVACEGMTDEIVTLPPMIQPTGDRETDIATREALGYISMVETLEGQVKVTCWEDKPAVDLTIYLVETR